MVEAEVLIILVVVTVGIVILVADLEMKEGRVVVEEDLDLIGILVLLEVVKDHQQELVLLDRAIMEEEVVLEAIVIILEELGEVEVLVVLEQVVVQRMEEWDYKLILQAHQCIMLVEEVESAVLEDKAAEVIILWLLLLILEEAADHSLMEQMV